MANLNAKEVKGEFCYLFSYLTTYTCFSVLIDLILSLFIKLKKFVISIILSLFQ